MLNTPGSCASVGENVNGRVKVPVGLLDFKNDLERNWLRWILPCWNVSSAVSHRRTITFAMERRLCLLLSVCSMAR